MGNANGPGISLNFLYWFTLAGAATLRLWGDVDAVLTEDVDSCRLDGRVNLEIM